MLPKAISPIVSDISLEEFRKDGLVNFLTNCLTADLGKMTSDSIIINIFLLNFEREMHV